MKEKELHQGIGISELSWYIDIESKERCDGIAARQRIKPSIGRAGQKPSSSHTCCGGTASAVSLGTMNKWIRQQGKDRCFISFLHLRLLLLACFMDQLQCYLLGPCWWQWSGPGLIQNAKGSLVHINVY